MSVSKQMDMDTFMSFAQKIAVRPQIDCEGKHCSRINFDITLSNCCTNCRNTRKEYMKNNPNLAVCWTDAFGFMGAAGCLLPQDQMPPECQEYDCKNYAQFIVLGFTNNEWAIVHLKEIHISQLSKLWGQYCDLLKIKGN